MPEPPIRRKSALVIAFAGLLAAKVVLADEHVVYQTNADDYSIGQAIAESEPVSLAADEFLVVFKENGETVRFEGGPSCRIWI